MNTVPPAGTPLIIPILSLVVAIVAVFVGPLVARANVQRQIRVTAWEAWMREFREQVSALLSSDMAFREHTKGHTTGDPEKEKRLEAIKDVLALSHNTIRLLAAERGLQNEAFIAAMVSFLNAPDETAMARRPEFIVGTAALSDQ